MCEIIFSPILFQTEFLYYSKFKISTHQNDQKINHDQNTIFAVILIEVLVMVRKQLIQTARNKYARMRVIATVDRSFTEKNHALLFFEERF